MLDPMLITARVTSILESMQVRYFIGGSIASTLYGMVRTTQDSDIVANLRQEHVTTFCSALGGEFYIDQEMISQAIVQNSSFNIIHRESFFKVDIFIPKAEPFVEQQMTRAIRQTLSIDPPVVAQVATAEDTLLAKLSWYRLGGEVSERQWRDVLGILEVQADLLDLDYMHRWAQELMVNELLERALADIQPE